MSDGPHRSLPMRRHWKHLAERAATPAYAREDVEEALPLALKKDFLSEAPLFEVAEILRGGKQGSLFPQACAEQLETIRDAHPGSVPACTLLDCAIQAVANGRRGEDALLTAIEQALKAHARSGCRQIEEHFHREGRHAVALCDRLRATRERTSYAELASELISDGPSAHNLRLTKHSGVDEGPPL